MKKWSALAILLAFAGALAFRLPRLEVRPLHNDEAVNAIKVSELWQQGRYVYDPDEYHGPTLHYATLPFLSLSGASGPDDLQDATLRLAPVWFGAALILLLFLFAGALSWPALAWSALFLAISPAMVFYSRYFIHEMLLVFFTALALGGGWRYAASRRAVWAVVTGAAIGLMFATKETFVITLAAMAVAGAATILVPGQQNGSQKVKALLQSFRRNAGWKHAGLAGAAMIVVWLLFFSSFFTNASGLLDSFRTYFPWLKRAAGHSPHLHPWYFYFERLAWFHPVKGPVFSEALVLLLGTIGLLVSLFRRQSPFQFFLAVYTVVLAAAYSAISYKTPWCLLSFYFGLILLAGTGAANLIQSVTRPAIKLLFAAGILALAAQLAVQSWRASFTYASDRRNPWVYAQTVPDILNLVKRAEGLSRVSPAGWETVVKVIAPDSDYWPLPWCLRRFKHIGWYDQIPEDPFAPIIIVAAGLDARLDEKSNRKWIMAGMTELRPGKFLELYVELGLWTKYVESLPPQPD
jgi:uncharacterized protein (TIGR03663 family)